MTFQDYSYTLCMFLPPNEKILETRKCALSGDEFVVTDKDAEMYEMLSPVIGGKKQGIPFPTLCPRERQIRRMIWRNYDHLYKNICALTGKEVITTYRPGTPYKVADLTTWWSDSWDQHKTALPVDFNRPFFDQFYELDQRVIHMPLSVSKSQNSNFTNFSVNNKNCYLSSRVGDCEDCYYCLLLVKCKNCTDCYDIEDSEYLYECIRTVKSYHSFFCVDCENCRDCMFLKDSSNCELCFGSCNLKNARFVFNNKQLTESEYQATLQKTFFNITNFQPLRAKFLTFCEQYPKKFMIGINDEDVLGNYLYSTARTVFGFECHNSDKLRYGFGCHSAKDSMDINFGYFEEKSLEICGQTDSYQVLFGINNVNSCHDLLYCKDCMTTTIDCFGCNSIKKGKNCMLNKPYSQAEYEDLANRCIDHMRSTGEWGEFFPAQYSPFAFNESAANAHISLEKSEVLRRGWQWYEEEIVLKNSGFVPLTIDQYDEKKVGFEAAQKNIDTLLAATLICTESGKPFTIIKPELAFYIENFLPVPRIHPTLRTLARMRQTLPMELYDRKCGECGQGFFTPYSPNRPEKILCDTCYRKLVY